MFEYNGFRLGDLVDVEWMPGEFWRGYVVIGFDAGFNDHPRAVCRTDKGGLVYPLLADLRVPV